MSGGAVEQDLFPADVFGGATPTSPLQFKIISITKSQASEIYSRYHYLSDKGFLHQFSFGALFDGILWGAITYAIPNPRNIKGLYDKDEQVGVLEISRLAFAPNSPKNSCSRMIGISTKLLKQRYPLRILISYADTAQNHIGTIYKASGFKYHGLTAKKTDFVDLDGNLVGKIKGAKYSEMDGYWVERSQKHLFSKIFKQQ